MCTKCGKSFKTKPRLQAHESRHSGAKPHICHSCGSAFPDRGGLAKHQKTVHASGARYACPSCGKTSNRLDNLRVHLRTHADPGLVNLTADELSVAADAEKQPDSAAPKPPVTADGTFPAAPVSAFCVLPAKSDAVETAQLRYAVPTAGAVDLFHDSSSYVQHCLSFVALHPPDYASHPDVSATHQLTYIHHQP